MATPKIYDTVSKNSVLNVYKYFKDGAMKFQPNHPQRSYVKKTAEAAGLPQRNISLMCYSPMSSTASSSAAAQNSQSVTTPPELLGASLLHCSSDPSARQDITTCYPEMASRAIIVDDFYKCVIRRKIAEAGFKTIITARWQSVCEYAKKLAAGQWARDNLCESEVEKLFVNHAEESSSKIDFNLLSSCLMQFNKL